MTTPRRLRSMALAAALAVGACAGPGGRADSAKTPDMQRACNPVLIGLGAAAACAALAKGSNRLRTGAACAAVAVTACYLANSYRAEQTRTAKQVEEEYLRKNPQLPEHATVTAYHSQVNPGGAVARGQEVRLVSTIVAVPGRSERAVLVEEEVAIFDSQQEAWGNPVRKTANSGSEAGEFQTSFTIPIRDGWSQGVYTLHRTLYVNGSVAQRDDMSTRFQVVRGADAGWLASALP